MANILIFDSGVGGLSILKAILFKVPQAQFVFASDNAAYPYGVKTEQALIHRVEKVVQQLVSHTKADMVVIACNTASTVMLPRLRELLSIPVVGVVPAIKPAVEKTKSKHIGVLATPATVNRAYTMNLIREYAKGCRIDLLGSAELVNLAEKKLYSGCVDKAAIKDTLGHWIKDEDYKKMDTIVLACTHFPLLKKELQEIYHELDREIMWVDSSQGIANRVVNLIKELDLELGKTAGLHNIGIFTKAIHEVDELKQAMQKLGIVNTQFIEI